MLDMGSPPEELRRNGNEHRQFIPVNSYPTLDGFIYMALGSDAQWRRLADHPLFASLDQPRYASNEGRRKHKEDLHMSIAAITRGQTRAGSSGRWRLWFPQLVSHRRLSCPLPRLPPR